MVVAPCLVKVGLKPLRGNGVVDAAQPTLDQRPEPLDGLSVDVAIAPLCQLVTADQRQLDESGRAWVSMVHRKAIRRGVFRSVAHLKDAIQRFLDAWNANCHPFAWVKTADQILASAKPKAISGPVHYSCP
jgi:hypothetical protein